MKDIEHFTYNEYGEFLTIPTMDKLCAMLKTKFQEQERDNDHLRSELKKLLDEKWKDTELQEMREELKEVQADARRGFSISESEYNAAMNWINEHEASKHPCPEKRFPRGGAIGGSYQWIFTPSSIGTFGEVKCSCGDSFTFQEEE